MCPPTCVVRGDLSRDMNCPITQAHCMFPLLTFSWAYELGQLSLSWLGSGNILFQILINSFYKNQRHSWEEILSFSCSRKRDLPAIHYSGPYITKYSLWNKWRNTHMSSSNTHMSISNTHMSSSNTHMSSSNTHMSSSNTHMSSSNTHMFLISILQTWLRNRTNKTASFMWLSKGTKNF